MISRAILASLFLLSGCASTPEAPRTVSHSSLAPKEITLSTEETASASLSESDLPIFILTEQIQNSV